MGPSAPLSFGAFGPKTYPPFGRDFQLAPAEDINGAFGPIKFWGLRPQNLFVLITGKGRKLEGGGH